MLSYATKDLDLVHEIETFLTSKRPSIRSETGLSNLFGTCNMTAKDYWWIDYPEDERPPANILLPHYIVAIMGHAGSGKSYTLKRFAGRYRTMFYAPTNQAGINLQNILWSEMLFSSSKKSVYRTIHSFFNISPDESNQLGKMVKKVVEDKEAISSYDQYLEHLTNACKPFCEKMFKKEMEQNALSPPDYWMFRDEFCKKHKIKNEECLHIKVVEYIRATGERRSIPDILMYDTCVLEEAGRSADYMAYLFLIYYYFMHFKYETFVWRQRIPVMMFVGSATQSRVIDEYSTVSALTLLGQTFMKDTLMRSGQVKIKMCKDNRRATTGNIENKTTLSLIIGKLELRRPVTDSLRKKFNDVYVTEENNFFDPDFRPDYFRIAKKHENLKVFKENVLRQNTKNKVVIYEYLQTTLECSSFTDLEGCINVKLKSESYDRHWINTRTKALVQDDEFIVYRTSRTLIKELRYLLTDHHSLYLRCFTGTVDQLFDVCEILHAYLSTNQKQHFLDFVFRCALFIWEDIYAKESQTRNTEGDELKGTLEQILQIKSELQNALVHASLKTKRFTYFNENKTVYLTLPKDTFSFVLKDVHIEQPKDENPMINVKLNLKFQDCLNLNMYYKTKSICTNELKSHTVGSMHENTQREVDFEKYRVGNTDNVSEEVTLDDDSTTGTKSFFRTIPLALHICSTIDSTQGLTIHNPILALLRKEDRAEDIIVALTRASNPDTLLVAYKVFDTKFEPIDRSTKSFMKTMLSVQKNDGWL